MFKMLNLTTIKKTEFKITSLLHSIIFDLDRDIGLLHGLLFNNDLLILFNKVFLLVKRIPFIFILSLQYFFMDFLQLLFNRFCLFHLFHLQRCRLSLPSLFQLLSSLILLELHLIPFGGIATDCFWDADPSMEVILWYLFILCSFLNEVWLDFAHNGVVYCYGLVFLIEGDEEGPYAVEEGFYGFAELVVEDLEQESVLKLIFLLSRQLQGIRHIQYTLTPRENHSPELRWYTRNRVLEANILALHIQEFPYKLQIHEPSLRQLPLPQLDLI